MLSKILYILVAVAVLLVLIMVHELGHYLAGKMLKFKINEFSIGFGKALYSKKTKSGEKFSIRILPLGGYCAFEGEDEESETEGAFNKQKPWKRLIVLFSGVFFNFIFGILTAVIYLAIASYQIPKISYIAKDNPNGFMVGDVVLAVDGKDVELYRSFSQMTAKYENGEKFIVTVDRGGEIIDLEVSKCAQSSFRLLSNVSMLSGKVYFYNGTEHIKLSDDEIKAHLEDMNNSLDKFFYLSDGQYIAYTEELLVENGLLISNARTSLGVVYEVVAGDYSFGEALIKAVPFCLYVCGLILSVLGGLFTGATAISEVGGTITAVSQMAEVASYGMVNLLYLLPLLSMNLALFNILPIPALDGARMVFVGIEWVRGKPINRNVEAYIHFIGLIVLFALVIFLDVYHIFFLK